MKIRCGCGSIIVDQTDWLPYKAYFVPDQLEEKMIDELLLHARNVSRVREGELSLKEMTMRYFIEPYPTPSSPEILLDEIIADLNVRFQRTIYECVECRSIVAVANDGSLVFYSRDTEPGGPLLAGSDSPEVVMSISARRKAGQAAASEPESGDE